MNKIIITIICLAFVSADIREEQQPTIDYVNSLETSWTAGHNPRQEGWTMNDYAHLCGDLDSETENMLPEKEIQIRTDIPASYDAREAYPRCESIQEIYDQANCGSCWAFGAAEAMSDRICIASGQTDQTRISFQDILACCGNSCGSCSGGFTDGAWNYYKNVGVRTGAHYGDQFWCQPYSYPPTGGSGTQTCRRECTATSGRNWDSDVNFAQSSYMIPTRNVQAMQTEILNNGPITASYLVYSDFTSYTGGVYQQTSGRSLGGHAIKIIGWGTEGGVDYWNCANSWGPSWGASGFFKIKRGSNECTIESRRLVAGMPGLRNNSFLK